MGAACLIAVALTLLATPAVAAPRLDARFGDGGVARLSVKSEGFREFFGALRPARQADGKMLVGAQLYGDRDAAEFVLARFDRDGTPDSTFGHGGRLKIGVPWFVPVRVLTQRDGRILLVGVFGGYRYFAYRPMQIGLVRLLPDGSRDRSFGANGLVAWNPPWDAAEVVLDISLGLVLPQPDGRLLIGGTLDERAIGVGNSVPERHSFMFVRFEPDGSVDASFGHAGMTELDLDGAYVRRWARLSDRRLVAVVSRHEGPGEPTLESTGWWLQSFAPDPSPGGGFLTAGSARLGLDVLDDLVDLAPTRDGGLLMIGNIDVDQRFGPVPALRRILPDGSLDPTFGRGCGGPLIRLHGSFSRGGVSTPDGGALTTTTKLLVHARPRRIDGFAITHDASGCMADRPLRLRGLVVGPPLLQGRRSALLGATFTRRDGLAGGVALIKIRR